MSNAEKRTADKNCQDPHLDAPTASKRMRRKHIPPPLIIPKHIVAYNEVHSPPPPAPTGNEEANKRFFSYEHEMPLLVEEDEMVLDEFGLEREADEEDRGPSIGRKNATETEDAKLDDDDDDDVCQCEEPFEYEDDYEFEGGYENEPQGAEHEPEGQDSDDEGEYVLQPEPAIDDLPAVADEE